MAGYNAFGTFFQRGDGAEPEVFATIGEATNLAGPGMTRETIDVTSHDSPDGFMEYVGGLKDGGEFTFDVNYDPAIHNILQNDFDDPLPRNYKLVLPDPPGGSWGFSAFITGMELEFPHDDKMTASMTFKVSGRPTFTEGS